MLNRICTQCGASYAADDTAKLCTATLSGRYCGGEIQPPPAEETRQAACLVCLDTGNVELADGSKIKCHRRCKEVKP